MPSFIHSDRGASFLSKEVKTFLNNHGIATSRTTPYHPTGNSQCERYNGVIWNTIKLAIESRKLNNSQWERVLPDSLHAIRTLLCTSTNETPHERLFTYTRKTSTGSALPTWLTNSGPVLLRKHVRHSKFEPLVESVELLEANPQYAYVKFRDGREDTVSIRDLAPCGSDMVENCNDAEDSLEAVVKTPPGVQMLSQPVRVQSESNPDEPIAIPAPSPPLKSSTERANEPIEPAVAVRRSERVRKPVQRLDL